MKGACSIASAEGCRCRACPRSVTSCTRRAAGRCGCRLGAALPGFAQRDRSRTTRADHRYRSRGLDRFEEPVAYGLHLRVAPAGGTRGRSRCCQFERAHGGDSVRRSRGDNRSRRGSRSPESRQGGSADALRAVRPGLINVPRTVALRLVPSEPAFAHFAAPPARTLSSARVRVANRARASRIRMTCSKTTELSVEARIGMAGAPLVDPVER